MRAVFLDRDGTFIIDKDYLVRKEDIEFIPGAIDALKLLKENGFGLVICTNQSAIARGMMTEEEYLKIQVYLLDILKKNGIEIDGCYYCPHLKEGSVEKYAIVCECRKPKSGMFERARDELGINMRESYAIGDSLRDMIAVSRLGAKTVLVRTGKGAKAEQVELVERFVDKICDDILEAAKWIIADCRHRYKK
ncbi:MAG: D-glycero-beta-D-manno-heptose 1,7-bisphosphate 7-phosphatase [Planctomycetota bacterium]|nr:D-glycero-beta-D-manno-heptose 1,7-bisphosphate 7-phosphatase [Planctomycetota bacterium]